MVAGMATPWGRQSRVGTAADDSPTESPLRQNHDFRTYGFDSGGEFFEETSGFCNSDSASAMPRW